MATIRGNEIALESVLAGLFPRAPAGLVQSPLSQNREPFYSVTVPAGENTWRVIDIEGYEVLILSGDDVRRPTGSIAYVRFSATGPESSTSSAVQGAVPVVPGTRIPVPQGFQRLWFLPGYEQSWRIVVSRLPHTHVEYGPYGAGTDLETTYTVASGQGTANNVTAGVATGEDEVLAFANGAPGTYEVYFYGDGTGVGGLRLTSKTSTTTHFTVYTRGPASMHLPAVFLGTLIEVRTLDNVTIGGLYTATLAYRRIS